MTIFVHGYKFENGIPNKGSTSQCLWESCWLCS